MVKNPPAMQETQLQSLDQEDPLEKGTTTRQPTPAFLPGESHGQRSLVRGVSESDMTEQLTLSLSPFE